MGNFVFVNCAKCGIFNVCEFCYKEKLKAIMDDLNEETKR